MEGGSLLGGAIGVVVVDKGEGVRVWKRCNT